MKSIVDYTNKLKDFFASNTALTNIIQESVFTVEESNGKWYLIWHGADGTCPFSVSQSGTDFILNFTYNT